MAKFAINASGAMLLPSLVQVSESILGSVVPLAMFLRSTGNSEAKKVSLYACKVTFIGHICCLLMMDDLCFQTLQPEEQPDS